MELLIHSESSTVQSLRFGNGSVISSHTFIWMWLHIHVRAPKDGFTGTRIIMWLHLWTSKSRKPKICVWTSRYLKTIKHNIERNVCVYACIKAILIVSNIPWQIIMSSVIKVYRPSKFGNLPVFTHAKFIDFTKHMKNSSHWTGVELYGLLWNVMPYGYYNEKSRWCGLQVWFLCTTYAYFAADT